MTDHAAATLATLRATIRRLALPASFALQPVPDWDALIAEQDAREAARQRGPVCVCFDVEGTTSACPVCVAFLPLPEPPALPAPPTAATAMPARALRPLQAAHGFRAHIRW